MKRLARFFSGVALLGLVSLGVGGLGVPRAEVINNGLTPPDPANVIDDDTYRRDWVVVRNVGCPPGWGGAGVGPWDPCPGTPEQPDQEDTTAVELADGGSVWWLAARDSSAVTVSGGTVWADLEGADSCSISMTGGMVGEDVELGDSCSVDMSGGSVVGGMEGDATITMSGGTVGANLDGEGLSTITMSGGTVVGDLEGKDLSTITMSDGTVVGDLRGEDFCRIIVTGGTVEGSLYPGDFCTVWIVGSGFQVDGVPVLYGPIEKSFGSLTGTLDTGDLINNDFTRGETGNIILTGTEPEIPPYPLMFINDGGSHTIGDGSSQSELLIVRNVGCGSAEDPWKECSSAGATTTLEIVTNGNVGQLRADDSSTIALSGGDVMTRVEGNGRSTITMSGGTVGGRLLADDSSTVTMTGGTALELSAAEESTVTMSDGTTQLVICAGDSIITLMGGTPGNLKALDSCTIWIIGHDFEDDENSPLDGPIKALEGKLTGTLDSGDFVFENHFSRAATASIIVTDTAPDTALVLWNDGDTHTISDHSYEDNLVVVRDAGCGSSDDPRGYCSSSGDPTIVEVVSGGEMRRLLSLDSSTITMSGGEIWGNLRAEDYCEITIGGETVKVGSVKANDFCSIVITDGVVTGSVEANDASSITISGGTVNGDLEADDFSTTVAISGGTLQGNLHAEESSEITLSGGVVMGSLHTDGVATMEMTGGIVGGSLNAYDFSGITIRGGTIWGDFNARDFSMIEIVGRDLAVDGAPVPHGECSPLAMSSGRLTGTLESGDLIDNGFSRDESANICTTVVPEPTTVLLHACALATLALLGRRSARPAFRTRSRSEPTHGRTNSATTGA